MKPVIRLRMSDVFKSFKIPIREFYKNRVYVQHHLHIQPSEIDNLSYYEYQWMIKDLIEMLKEQNGKSTDSNMDVDSQMNKIKKQSSSYSKMPKLPKMGNMGKPRF